MHRNLLHGALGAVLCAVCLISPAAAQNAGRFWSGFNPPGINTDPFFESGARFVIYRNQPVLVGEFLSVGSTLATGVVSWSNGEWQPFGSGIGNGFPKPHILGAAAVNGDLFVATAPRTRAPEPRVDIQRWDGHGWEVATQIYGMPYSAIRCLGSYRGQLVVGGAFQSIAGVAASCVAAWDGTAWHALGTGVSMRVDPNVTRNGWGSNPAAVDRLLTLGDELFVSGHFDCAGGKPTHNIARFDGRTWRPLGRGIRARISALGEYQGQIVAAGDFQEVDGLLTPGIVRWDGVRWRTFGTGSPHRWNCTQLVTDGGLLYAAVYDCDDAGGGTPRGYFAIWDGAGWRTTAKVFDVPPSALLVHNGEMWAAGRFEFVDGRYANGLAASPLQDLASWTALAPGAGCTGTLYVDYSQSPVATLTSLAVFQGDLYAAGNFRYAGGVATGRIARWDGHAWHPVAAFDGNITSLSVTGGLLAVTGSFRHVDDTPVTGLAAWNGTSWTGFGGGFGEREPEQVLLHGEDLFAVGAFNYAEGRLVHGVARWTGSAWTRVGTPVWQDVHSAAVYRGRLVIAGGFNWDGRRTVRSLAEWDGTSWSEFHGGANGSVDKIAVFDDRLYAVGSFTEIGGVQARQAAVWDGTAWSPMSTTDEFSLQGLVQTRTGVHALATHIRYMAPNRNSYIFQTSLVRWDGTAWTSLGSSSFGRAGALQADGDAIYIGGEFTDFGGVPSGGIARWDPAPAAARSDVAVEVHPALHAFRVTAHTTDRAVRIAFDADRAGPVRAVIWDVRGRRVRQIDAAVSGPGPQELSWDERDANRGRVARGVYFVQLLHAGRRSAIGRAFVLRP